MSTQHNLLIELSNITSRVLYPLTMERKLEKRYFFELRDHLQLMTIEMKADSFIEKEILVELLTLINALRDHKTSSEYEEAKKMAQQLEKFFYLLINSETINDRQPGVPRII